MQLVATLPKYNKLAPNILLYWNVIKYYFEAGISIFDFGRCTINSSTYEFKRRWHPEKIQLNYQYWIPQNQSFSPISPDSPKYKRAITMWRKLPLWLTRLAGPIISRNLP